MRSHRPFCLPLSLALAVALLAFVAQTPGAAHAGEKKASRFGAKINSLVEKVKARVHLPEKIRRPLKETCRLIRGQCTLAADRLEGALPRKAASIFHRARLLSPGTLAGFGLEKFNKNPAAYAGIYLGTSALGYLEIPALMAFGVAPGLAYAIQRAVDVPLTFSAILWQEHRTRTDKSQTLLGTARGLGLEYSSFAETRRGESRRFMSERAAAKAAKTKPAGETIDPPRAALASP